MSWPVSIIIPAESVAKIRWKRWFYALFLFSVCIMIVALLLRAMQVLDDEQVVEYFLPLIAICAGSYLIAISLRVYCYGVSLSARDAYIYDVEKLHELWVKWASEPLYIYANHFFLPKEIVLADILSGNNTEVLNRQSLKLYSSGTIFSEADLINELLSAVRSKIKMLAPEFTFDVIFSGKENSLSFSIFRDCWSAMTLDDRTLNECYFYDGSHEELYEHLMNADDKHMYIIVSIRTDNYDLLTYDTTEYASILLISKRDSCPGAVNCGLLFRPMSCNGDAIENNFLHMRTYQPELMNTTDVFFGCLEQEEIIAVSDMLRNPLLNKNWEFETYNLNMMLGQLSGEHFWLGIAIALCFSELKMDSSLVIGKVGGELILNVVKPSNYHKENFS